MEIKDKITITCGGKEYNLCEPTFEVYGRAMQQYVLGGQKLDLTGAGKIIFDACYLGNQGDLDIIQSDVKLYANICFKASNLIEFLEGDIKKN